MTDQAEISLLLKVYMDHYHLSWVDLQRLKSALETADQEMLSILVTLITNREFPK